MKTKLKSKTMWAGAITTAAGVVGIFNPEAGALIASSASIILAAVGSVMMILRKLTTKPVK